jgi:hypothetical protein
MAGKGSTPRAVNGCKYRANFEAIFKKSKSERLKYTATPETDALIRKHNTEGGSPVRQYIELDCHARRLERERDKALALAEIFEGQIARLNKTQNQP